MSEVRRIFRGGSFNFIRVYVRCAYRLDTTPDIRLVNYGFRVVVNRARKDVRRVLRGGSFHGLVRPACRDWFFPFFRPDHYGLRVVKKRVRGKK